MLQKIMRGRLGNQMFQYATSKAFQKKFNNQSLNICYIKNIDNNKCELDNFKLNKDNVNIENKLSVNLIQCIILICIAIIEGVIKIFTNKRLFEEKRYKFETKIQPFINKYGIIWFKLGYYKFDFSKIKTKSIIIVGYFESSKYFREIRQDILEEFKPKYDILDKNKNMYKLIENTNSVCVSIRRGDFVNNVKTKDRHLVCTKKYYEKAIKEIRKEIRDCKFFVFSDDITWVRENMDFPEDSIFEDGNDPTWEKIRLMYSCKHFIISNSSFSWWAQYLSRNENKIVIAPSKWQNYGYNPSIYEENWRLLEV